MISMMLVALFAQTPAVRRSTPLTDDPGMVVRQTGTVTVTCTNCSGGGGIDGGVVTANQGVGADGGAWQVYVINPSGGSGGTSVQGVGIDGGAYWSVNGTVQVTNTVPVTGPLTDTQLRATPVPVSGTVAVSSVGGTVAVSAASLPLPSGAATSALQTTGNASLSSIDSKAPPLGQTTMVNSVPVAIASNQSAVPVSGTVAATQSGTWTNTVTQATGTNLHVVVDSAPTTAVTGPLTDAQLRATPVPVSGTVTASNASVSTTGTAPPGSATLSGASVTTAAPSYTTGQMNALSITTTGDLRTRPVYTGTINAAVPTASGASGFSDGTNLQLAKVYDTDTSGGFEWTLGATLRSNLFGGSQPFTTATSTGGYIGLTVFNMPKMATGAPVSSAVTCATTATAAPVSPSADRVTLTLYNNSSVTIYIGSASVTTANGLPLLPGASFTDDVFATPYYCRVASGTADLRVLEN